MASNSEGMVAGLNFDKVSILIRSPPSTYHPCFEVIQNMKEKVFKICLFFILIPQSKCTSRGLHFSCLLEGKITGGLALVRLLLVFKLQIVKQVKQYLSRLTRTILAHAKFSSLSSPGETVIALSVFAVFAVLMFLLIFNSLYSIRCCTQPELSQS